MIIDTERRTRAVSPIRNAGHSYPPTARGYKTIIRTAVSAFRPSGRSCRHFRTALRAEPDTCALCGSRCAFCRSRSFCRSRCRLLRSRSGLLRSLAVVCLLGLTLPRLTQTRQSETASFSAANFASLLKLLLRQDDGLPWNSPGGFGQLYSVPGLLFALLGLGEYFYRLRAKKTERGEIYVFIALCSSLAASFFIRVNVNRMNMIYLPLIWYQGRGLSLTGRRIALSAAQAAALLTAAGLFAGFYFGAYAQRLSPLFFGGLGEAIEYAEELDGGEIWISSRVNMPYIFALFYSRTPPGEFIESVVYEDPDAAFRQVRAFGRFRFGDSPPPGAVYIAPAGAEKGAAAARFDNYTVARTEKN